MVFFHNFNDTTQDRKVKNSKARPTHFFVFVKAPPMFSSDCGLNIHGETRRYKASDKAFFVCHHRWLVVAALVVACKGVFGRLVEMTMTGRLNCLRQPEHCLGQQGAQRLTNEVFKCANIFQELGQEAAEGEWQVLNQPYFQKVQRKYTGQY